MGNWQKISEKKTKKFEYLEAEIEVNEDWRLKTCILSHA